MAKHETRTIALGSQISFGLPFGLFLAKSTELDSNLILCGTVAALIFLFLFATGQRAASVEPRLAMRIFAFGIPPLLVATALIGAGCAVSELLRLDDAIRSEQTLALFGVLWAVTWFAFGRWARAQGGPELRRKAVLLVGSTCLLVVLVSWPIERVTSRRDEFMSGLGGVLGIGLGIFGLYWALAVLLISRFSPGPAHSPTGGGG